MVAETITNILAIIWPTIIIVTGILASLRIAYVFTHQKKVVLYKELINLAFIIYILSLFYVVSYKDVSWSTENYIPFREIFRYDIGSELFFRNVLGNMLLFIPYGFFASYYIKPKKGLVIFFLTVLTSLLIEVTQAKIGRVFDVDDIILNLCGGITGYFIFRTLDFIKLNVPKILKKGWILNIIIIVLISLFLLYFNNFF